MELQMQRASYEIHKSYLDNLKWSTVDDRNESLVDHDPLVVPELLKTDKQKGDAFRTRTCDNVAAGGYTGTTNPRDPRTEYKSIDVFKKKHLQPAEGWENAKGKIACMVYSHAGNRVKQRESFATWGQDCDHFLLFSNEVWEDKKAGFKTIEVHPPAGTSFQNDRERNLIGKLHEAFKKVQRMLDSKELDFDYLTVSGDDALWLVPNLRYDLANNKEVLANPEKGFIYGHMFSQGPGVEFPSGAGYVLDKKALKTYAEDRVVDQGWWEDVRIAQSMRNHGVSFIHAQEESGEHLAMFFNPESHSHDDIYTAKGWVSDYERPFFDRMKGKVGIDTISKRAVLFHYCNDIRYSLHNQFWAEKACKGSQSSLLQSSKLQNAFDRTFAETYGSETAKSLIQKWQKIQ